MKTGDITMSDFFLRDSNRVPLKEFDYDIINSSDIFGNIKYYSI